MVVESRKLLQEKGILESPEAKKGRSLPNDTLELVKSIYCDDEYSRQMPGKKDYVCVKKCPHAKATYTL
jgi:hypothetical protein